MENNTELYSLIRKKAENCALSLFQYAAFVNDMQYLAEQNSEIFNKDSIIFKYNSLWLELEILNSIALEEWENIGKPIDFSDEWNEKYYNEIKELINELLCFLKTLFVME